MRPIRRAAREPVATPHVAIETIAHVGPLAFLAGIIGGIAGWLLSAGAVPRPDFLPALPAEPLYGAALVALLGLLAGGLVGGIAHLADRTQEVEPPPTPPEEQS